MDDLVQLVTDTVSLGFDIAGGLKTAATLHINKSEGYNFDTDSATESGGSDIPVQGIFYRQKQAQAAETSGQDATFMVKGSDAPAGIDQADTITINGTKWQIDLVEPTPANAAYLLHIRL